MINALFNKAISRNGLVWALGIVGTLLSVIGIINYFTNFLTLLGVAIPPVAGIMVVDYFILKRSRATLDASRAKGELPEKVEKWNPIAIVCWIAGFAVGEVTSIMNAGIPGLNSAILAGVLLDRRKVYASIRRWTPLRSRITGRSAVARPRNAAGGAGRMGPSTSLSRKPDQYRAPMFVKHRGLFSLFRSDHCHS